MVHVSQEQDRYLAAFEVFERNGARKEPSWIHRIRKAAISRFATLGFPTTRHEEWKYTNLAPLLKIPFTPADDGLNGLTVGAIAPFTFRGLECPQLVFVNGHYSRELSSLRFLPEGVTVGSLAAALRDDPEGLEPFLARQASYQDHAFVALNTAFIEDGAAVYIPRGKVVEVPIHLLFVSHARGTPSVRHPRNLIVVGEDSQAVIIESYVSLESDVSFTNAVTEIIGGENTVVTHYRLQRESEKVFHIATVQSHLQERSNFLSHSITLGGRLVRNDVNAVLDGEGIECTLDGLYLMSGEQHVDNHTRIDHVKPHCSSRELYKGILGGRSRGVFNGKIYVHKAAQKTDAKQTNKNLLLSEGAAINTKPQLEIYADDVKCTHGSTIGQIDPDALFYLRSRGIGIESARGLLTYAFASEMVNRIRSEPLRAHVENLVRTQFYAGMPSEERS